MKKKYEAPTVDIDVLKYEISDVITVSAGDNDVTVPGDWF
jgi:hypothetical protein